MANHTAEYVVELLSDQHDRSGFACGTEALDRYLQRQARQDADRNVAVTYVLVRADAPSTIAGFYSLCALAVRLEDLPVATAKKLPRYPLVPVTLLARFAISQRHQGQRLGEYLLMDALQRCLEQSRRVASAAVIVDAKDQAAKAFYERYGFIAFPSQPLRLFLPMRTIAKAFGSGK